MVLEDNTGKSVYKFFISELEGRLGKELSKTYFFWLMWAYEDLEKIDLTLFNKKRFSENDLLKWKEAVSRILNGEPIQYVAGKTEFCDLLLEVDSNVLIPRSETEELVARIAHDFEGIRDIKGWDIGTGSGCIPLALMKRLPGLEMQATDVSKTALSKAKKNEILNQVAGIKWKQHNILTDPVQKQLKFDFIVSNPPYVLLNEKNAMQKSVVDHEPETALFVPDDTPLLFYEKIVEIAQNHLNDRARLYFEIHEDYGVEVSNLLRRNRFTAVEIVKDLQDKERIVVGQLVNQ